MPFLAEAAVCLHYKAGITPNLDEVAHFPDGSRSPVPIMLDEHLIGETTYSLPATPLGTPATGYRTATYDGDFYHRIHLTPIKFDLGNVLQAESRTFEVWNAHFSAKTLDGITEDGADGLVLSGGPMDPPVVFGPLRSHAYTLTITLDGPLAIEAAYEFDFDGANDVTLVVVGSRAVIFAFEPQLPIGERLEWLTDVQEAYSGAEQRVMVRHKPRQTIEATYLLHEQNEVSRALNTLYGRVGGTIAVPTWWDLRPLLADVAAGGTTVPVDTTHADFRDGGFALLWRSSSDFEVVQIDSVADIELVLVRPLEGDHAAVSTVVVPLQRCLAPDPLPTKRRGVGVTTLEIAWASIEPVDLTLPDEDLTIYRGLPVLDDINFMDGTELSEPIQSGALLVDNETGPGARSFRRRRMPRIVTMKGWAPETPAEVGTLRRLLHALRGRQRSFWLPTFRNDFQLTTAIGSTDVALFVMGAEYQRFIDRASPLGDIAIYLRDGTVFYREIVDVMPGTGAEQLVIDSALGTAVQPEDVARISYLMRARLDSDVVAIQHLGLGRAQAFVPVVGVEQ